MNTKQCPNCKGRARLWKLKPERGDVNNFYRLICRNCGHSELILKPKKEKR